MTSRGDTLTKSINKIIARPVKSAETNQTSYELYMRVLDVLRDGMDVIVEADTAVMGEHVPREYGHMSGLWL